MKHTLSAVFKNVRLRPVREEDLEPLRLWRCDEKATKYLTKIDHITPKKQREWFESDNANQHCYTFAIEETQTLKRMVGSVALYNIDGFFANFGRFLIGDLEARGKGIGSLGTILCLYIGFTELGLKTVTAHVHEENTAAIKAYEKGGFAVTGEHLCTSVGKELEIAVKRDKFLELHNYLHI